MHPLLQRCNAAYLNRQISRFGELDPRPSRPGTASRTGLAFDLDGSLERRFRPDEFGAAYLDELLPRLRRGIEAKIAGEVCPTRSYDLCVLMVELSGAHAGV